MIKVNLILFLKDTDIISPITPVGFPNQRVATTDVTNYLIEDDLIINKKIEYDDIMNVAVGDVEVSFIDNNTIKDLLIRKPQQTGANQYIVGIEIFYFTKLLFQGYLDPEKIIYNYDELIYTANFIEWTGNIIDYLDNRPIPEYALGEVVTLESVFNNLVSKYLQVDILDYNNIYNYYILFFNSKFQNSTQAEASSYKRLYDLSILPPEKRNFVPGTDRFSAKDFLMQCLKYYNFYIFMEDKKLYFVDAKSNGYLGSNFPTVNLADKILSKDYIKEYDYKENYNGVVLNLYPSFYGHEGWYLLRKDSAVVHGRGYPIVRVNDVTKDNLDLRMELFSNFKTPYSETDKYTRGYSQNAVVFNHLTFAQYIDGQPYISQAIGDFYKSMLKTSPLTKLEAIGLEYYLTQHIIIDGIYYRVIELNYNISEGKSNLILRNI